MPDPQFLPGQTVSAAQLQRLGDEDTYTPTLVAATTDPTLGTGSTQDGKLWLNGNHVEAWITIRFGSSGAAAGSGVYYIELPTAYPITTGWFDVPGGEGRLIDDSGATEDDVMCVFDVPNNRFRLQGDISPGGLVTNALPWVWANNDWILAHVSYLTDFGV